MPLKFPWRLIFLPLLALVAAVATLSRPENKVTGVRLYTLDCGRAELKDMAMFSDTGEYTGKPGAIAVTCFLIQHPKGTLVWDTGMGDNLAEKKEGVDNGGIHMTVSVTLAEQLNALGLAPSDVTYVAFSHFHFDHTGNANLFSNSTWILNQSELNWALSSPTPGGVVPAVFSGYKTAKTNMINGDFDVFGDGSVRILRTPGHTPGHQVLEVRLKKAGTVILSGDLYHLRDNYLHQRVPDFNFSRADTLASMERIEKIIKNSGARLVVQHDLGDFKAMPKFPAYLE
jgi:glyoxylase-like metal-dependent hydrolase (beta-lactamase superfamily II)